LGTPISVSYASPANRASEYRCAFQPNRPTDPSEPAFGLPEIPNSCLAPASEAWLLRMTPSGMLSINPAPNVGVGIRKLRLAASLKSGWLKTHFLASDRPVIVNNGATSPSRIKPPWDFRRTARIGPSSFRNSGMEFRDP